MFELVGGVWFRITLSALRLMGDPLQCVVSVVLGEKQSIWPWQGEST